MTIIRVIKRVVKLVKACTKKIKLRLGNKNNLIPWLIRIHKKVLSRFEYSPFETNDFTIYLPLRINFYSLQLTAHKD